jgi:hypothetical protein
MYAKIDENGDVVEFPYRAAINLLHNTEIPADAVKVDMYSNKPNVSWKQIARVTNVTKSGEFYVANFEVADRYTNDDSMLDGIKDLKMLYTDTNERTFKQRVKKIKANTPDEEVLSWDAQRTEALAYRTDNTADVPLLTSIATARGITIDEMVTKVLNAVDAYNVAYGELLGKYQKNADILEGIDLENNSTWDAIDLIERL